MNTETHIEQLFNLGAYPENSQTDSLFLAAVQDELIFHYEHNLMFKHFCERKCFNPYEPFKIDEIPAVAVSVFKELGASLNSVPQSDIKFSLQSSATSGIPSTIVVDKVTSKRQSKAMIKVIQEYIGSERKPFLVMDIDPRSEHRQLLGARFAAVSGYLTFASKVGYFLKADKYNVSYFDVYAMQKFLLGLPTDKPVIVFGFTYILYANVLKNIRGAKIEIRLPKGSKIIHIGGWKKLESEKISKELFNTELASCFGVDPSDIIDIYGFTEQMGLNYPDCPCGCKHTSAFSRVIIRDLITREVLPAGKEGMLEFISPIPHSYPGNVVLTDDLGIVEKEPCPYGRSGTRFRILGRVKKAEIRGCGDILSSKLTFQNKKSSPVAIEERLEVLLHNGNIQDTLPTEKLKQLIKQLREQSEWLYQQPIEALIGLIAEIAKKWGENSSLFHLKDKGLIFLSSWCDYKHLTSMLNTGLKGNLNYLDCFLPFPDSDRHYLKANPRGLACHWLAGNVQILGLFALIQSILAKNVNLLKVSARDNGVFTELLDTFRGVNYTTSTGYSISGDDLLKTISVVYFPREAHNIGETMSKEADIRIAWGGKEAVETVANYPTKFDTESIIFGPKLSFSVIAKESLVSETDAKKLARRIAVDVSVFDQSGCASPHNLYIETGGVISPEQFIEILAKAFDRTEIQIPKTEVSVEQVSQIHSIRGVYDFKGTVKGSPTMSWTLLINPDNELNKPIYSRVLFVHIVSSIFDTLKHITENIQSIGIEAPKEKALNYATQATHLGVSRCPTIGRMLNFEMPWDGIFLLDRLVKWNTYGGPLR
ncbi:acyl-CoA reductase [Parabacteroides goldsteinii]|uniref:LuxE/PaaK family acyltransferase n=1 Tax=Parabacteroides goldsteinii TaxID=328812 RepID=UPI00069DB3C4|nr:acyl-CoA reductase [Parabacteroides goldsteinii]